MSEANPPGKIRPKIRTPAGVAGAYPAPAAVGAHSFIAVFRGFAFAHPRLSSPVPFQGTRTCMARYVGVFVKSCTKARRGEAVITLDLNGRRHEADAPNDKPLLWVFRDELKMTGTWIRSGIGRAHETLQVACAGGSAARRRLGACLRPERPRRYYGQC